MKICTLGPGQMKPNDEVLLNRELRPDLPIALSFLKEGRRALMTLWLQKTRICLSSVYILAFQHHIVCLKSWKIGKSQLKRIKQSFNQRTKKKWGHWKEADGWCLVLRDKNSFSCQEKLLPFIWIYLLLEEVYAYFTVAPPFLLFTPQYTWLKIFRRKITKASSWGERQKN